MNDFSFSPADMQDQVPRVMGVLNVTPDSFYDGGNYLTIQEQIRRAEQILEEGAEIVDIGAVSTRPGSVPVTEEEELNRLIPSIRAILKVFPKIMISVDTFRSKVARIAVEEGAGMINDIYGGRYEQEMIPVVAELGVPYVLMHMKGTPANMQINPRYRDVVADIYYFFENQLTLCRQHGLHQVILDPGFGFGKNLEHNFTVLARLREFQSLGKPILAGISRKSMIHQLLNLSPSDSLNATTVLNTLALENGASILRVHDVREAVETVRLFSFYRVQGLVR